MIVRGKEHPELYSKIVTTKLYAVFEPTYAPAFRILRRFNAIDAFFEEPVRFFYSLLPRAMRRRAIKLH